MQRIKRYSSGGSERGSTLLEVIVALLVLSLIGIGAWSAASVSLRTARRTHDGILTGSRLLQLDDRTRDLAGRVLTPFWMTDPEVTLDGTKMSVAYLDGDPGKSFSLEFSDGVLTLTDGDQPTRFGGFQGVEMAPALDADKHIIGVRLDLQTGPGRRTTIIARFGGTPMRTLPPP
jgi:type II secretory pathway pseudopilin PulG